MKREGQGDCNKRIKEKKMTEEGREDGREKDKVEKIEKEERLGKAESNLVGQFLEKGKTKILVQQNSEVQKPNKEYALSYIHPQYKS